MEFRPRVSVDAVAPNEGSRHALLHDPERDEQQGARDQRAVRLFALPRPDATQVAPSRRPVADGETFPFDSRAAEP
jgi:hypothetical protein